MDPKRSMAATASSIPCRRSHSLIVPLLLLTLAAAASAETHYHEFVVEQTPVTRLCRTRRIITVNGMYPGPTLQIRNGDSLVVSVVNRAQYNVTIHWHGVRQLRTAWADGPEFVTQCPIRPGGSYTYRFTVEGQEGTLWWHAHSSWLRATVYGALIIYPKEGSWYPFPTPRREFPVMLGEWWNANPIDVVRQALRTGGTPNVSDAFTINGQPGDLYQCSNQDTAVFPVGFAETVLLRVINSALNQELFFSIGGHRMTVVGADASYTKPFTTRVLMLGPGQTTDVLITTNRRPSRYYMAARAYSSAPNVPFDNTTATAVLNYDPRLGPPLDATVRRRPRSAPRLPALPFYNDTPAATAFFTAMRSLSAANVPNSVGVKLLFTVGLGLFRCPPGRTCAGPNNTILTASMNNVSFVLPSTYPILQADRQGVRGVFSAGFPAVPPVQFDYTAQSVPRRLWQPVRGTEVLRLSYGTSVQLVLQGTSIVAPENHPMHIHGYDFYVMATGFGNFVPGRDEARFNYIDPPRRNTVPVPAGGWAAIRFVADNPGAWLMHCHLDVHLTWGLAMVFLVEDGPGEMERLEPPPPDLPTC